ncbi:MAG: aminotransferase class V-fold PLP-dependent enzyme, partial [Thermoanaerobaculia bacterium]
MNAITKTAPEVPAASEIRVPPYGVEHLRAEFPILSRTVYGKPLVYLDNANTTQKPRTVIDSDRRYYEEENANIHRGTHWLSEKATEEYEGARAKVARFLGAASPKEIVFTRGTTEAINLVASSFSQAFLKAGDEILITGLEHHSNIVPWQLACQRTGAKLVVVPITDEGEVPVGEFERRLTARTKLAAVSHVSNALGTVNPVKAFIALAHARSVPVLVDGAQAAPHLPIDVADLGCDFYAVSGHKMYGPTGIGALYGREAWLEKLPPYQGGGDMISSVTFEKTTYNVLPWKFEAGTANIAGGIGFGVAADWLS